MTEYLIECGGCRQPFIVTDVRDPERPSTTRMPAADRCSHCGTNHEPDPDWTNPVVTSSPLLEVDEPRVLLAPPERGGQRA